MEHAGLGRRLVAGLIDVTLLFFIFCAVGVPIAKATPDTERFDPATREYVSTDTGNVLVLIWIAAFYFVVVPLYFALSQGRGAHASLGKHALGLRVGLGPDGHELPTVPRMLGRQLLIQTFWLPVLPGIAASLWSFFDDRGRALHDRICNTVVLKASAAEPSQMYERAVTCWGCGAVNVIAPPLHRFYCYACGRENLTAQPRSGAGGTQTAWSPKTTAQWTLIFIGGWNVLLGIFKYNFEAPVSFIAGGLALGAGLIWRYIQKRERKQRPRTG